jgi:hypothetical protein
MTTYRWLGFALLLWSTAGCNGSVADDMPADDVADWESGFSDAAATPRYIRPPSECAYNGNGKAHGCASRAGADGAFNAWSTSKSWLAPGTVLYVDGTWNVTSYILVRSSGTATEPIHIRSYDLNAPSPIQGDLSGLFYVQANYVSVTNLRFYNSLGTCMAVFGPTPTQPINHVAVNNNRFDKCYNGISLRYVENALVSGNWLRSEGGMDGHGHCIYPAEGADHIEVRGNRCQANPDIYASHCLHVYHAEAPGPADDVAFHDNVCDGFSTGVGIYSNAQNIRVYGNTIINLRKTVGSEGFGMRCGVSAGAGGSGVFMNNIVEGEFTSAVGIMDRTRCDLDIDYNVYDQPGSTPVFRAENASGSVAVVPWTTWRQTHDAHSMLSDPQLIDVATGDVHLSSKSPLRDRGNDHYVGTKDFYGKTRLVDGTIDIGAVEYQ